ncbi:MAG TPA: hypothetical protein VFX49_18360 [Chloroflexota bacterium]|nr:hypothetical protein [Chloroflexota bacterium]
MDEQTLDMGVSMETEDGLAIIDALNEVSDVLAMAGPKVTFKAHAPVPLTAPERLAGAQLYRCPRGLFLFFREADSTGWGVVIPSTLL